MVNMEKVDITLIAIFFLITIILSINGFSYFQLQREYSKCINTSNYYANQLNSLYNEYQNNCESCQMCGFNYTKQEFGIRGILINHNYYCVWIKNWNMSSTVYTVNHEIAHAMVHDDPTHFCGSYKGYD